MQRATTLIIKQTTSQLRDAAMLQAGLSPKVMALKPGTRVERNRKAALRRGHVKHKARAWD